MLGGTADTAQHSSQGINPTPSSAGHLRLPSRSPTCHELWMTQHPLSQEESCLPLMASRAALEKVAREVQGQQAVPPIPGGHWRGRGLLLLLICVLLPLWLLAAAAAAAALQCLLLQLPQALHSGYQALPGWRIGIELVHEAWLRGRGEAHAALGLAAAVLAALAAAAAAADAGGDSTARLGQQAGAVEIHQLLAHLLPILLRCQHHRPQRPPAGTRGPTAGGLAGRPGDSSV